MQNCIVCPKHIISYHHKWRKHRNEEVDGLNPHKGTDKEHVSDNKAIHKLSQKVDHMCAGTHSIESSGISIFPKSHLEETYWKNGKLEIRRSVNTTKDYFQSRPGKQHLCKKFWLIFHQKPNKFMCLVLIFHQKQTSFCVLF